MDIIYQKDGFLLLVMVNVFKIFPLAKKMVMTKIFMMNSKKAPFKLNENKHVFYKGTTPLFKLRN
jgi:hypothetical protein